VSSPSPENIDVLAAPVADAGVPAGDGYAWAADAQPKLTVTRGLKQNIDYPIYPGQNYIGRADEKPVDVDLDDQEPPDRVWSSRQHALLMFENGSLTVEDLNSANGTFINRQKLAPGQKQTLKPDDVIQIGTVQLKVKA
jgi:pSer/pThr/pTyr-binding forkhead associated (FHA) protein